MQKTAYEMRISDWSSDVCSSDLEEGGRRREASALPRRGCLIPHAATRNGIDMVDVGNARRTQFFGGVQHRFAPWITRRMNAELERSARAAQFARPQTMIFQCNDMQAHDVPVTASTAATSVGNECLRSCSYRW